MMDWIETNKGVVFPWHCDFNNHMNVMHYVGKFDEATWHLFAQAGINRSYMTQTGIGMVAVDQHIQYFQEFLPGDLIVVRSRFREVKNSSIHFAHRMYHFGQAEAAAECRLVGVHIDAESRKSIPFPEHIRKKLEQLTSGKK
ncbi:MAG: thioesterase family protein [Bacteroidota bacterium]